MTDVSDMKEEFEVFVAESCDMLELMETELLSLEKTRSDESINAVFRAVHTIKGTAGIFGLEFVVRFAHVVEDALDRLRKGDFEVTSELVDVFLRSKDHLAKLVDAVDVDKQEQSEPSAELALQGAELIACIEPYLRQAKAISRAVGDDQSDVSVEEQAEVVARASETRTFRIDGARLDRLIESVGELVIAGAGASVRASVGGDENLVTAMREVMREIEEVRSSALRLRMVPIGATFNRFERVVRDISASLGKNVELKIDGADAEIDKALVDRITDPLTHLVRNALDHGIETPEEREAAGKPTRGTLRLNAFHESGSIVIEVSDDGRGINTDKVLARAIERGIVDSGVSLSDSAIYELLFEPGFSTAEKVTDLSGRGVGMDVVRDGITSLRGTIEIASELGRGTTMQVKLPLTLAIIDGFLVEVGDRSFVIPLDRVDECVELPESRRAHGCMGLRGEVLPFVSLRELLSIDSDRPRRENVVVVEYSGRRAGLVVDALRGEYKTVIKPLSPIFGSLEGIVGSSILGDGDVALIVDVPSLIRLASRALTPV